MTLTLKSQRQFVSAIASLPQLYLAAAIPDDIAALVKEILEEFYVDGVDKIVSAELDEAGNVVGEFTDRVGLRDVKRFGYKISLEEVSYWLLNAAEVGKFSLEVYAPKKTAPAKKKNCKKGIACGLSCISATKICKKSPTAATKAKITKAKAAIAETETAAKTKAPPTTSGVSVNSKILEKERSELIKRFGEKTVIDAEVNVEKILDESSIFIRVGSESTLESILGDRFKTSAELGTKDHDIPYLKGDYETARKRTEKRVLGITESTGEKDRPIYGYFGGDDLTGASHAGTRAYGDIVVQLKPETKSRSTFTGADSFKSGTASEAISTGSPPPPNAASLIGSTRHGYDRAKLPSYYPEHYKEDRFDSRTLKGAATAKSIDELAPRLASTGNAYVEAQVHGGVAPKDIAALHFTKGRKPTEAIAKLAREQNIEVYVSGKKLSDRSLSRIKDLPPAPKPEPGIALKHTSELLDKRRKGLISKHGAELVEKAEANMKAVFDKAEVFIRADSSVADKIIADRFKSQFETGTSGGALAKDSRARTETTAMSYPKVVPKEMRPIYGYWGDTGDHGWTAHWYGDVIFRLKKTATERATFTRDDSLGGGYPASARIAPSVGAFDPRTTAKDLAKIAKAKSIRELHSVVGPSSYIEAQIHGQVTPDDIEEIIYTRSKPSAFAKEWAKSKGVKLSVK